MPQHNMPSASDKAVAARLVAGLDKQDIWDALPLTEKRDLILESFPQEAWFEGPHLSVLALFRTNPVQWGRICSIGKTIGVNIWHLEKAVDALRLALPRTRRSASDPPPSLPSTATTALDLLSEEWGLTITAVIRHGTENTFWHLRLEDTREIGLGETPDIFEPKRVRIKIFEVCGHLIPRYKGDKGEAAWDRVVALLVSASQLVDTPELTRLGQAQSLLIGYLAMERCALDHDASSEEWQGLALANKPFVRGAHVHVHARHMWLHYIHIMAPQMSQAALIDLLRLVGGRRVTMILNAKGTSRSFWRLPPAMLVNAEEVEEPYEPREEG